MVMEGSRGVDFFDVEAVFNLRRSPHVTRGYGVGAAGVGAV
jgi:hypothetical protein